MPKKRNATPLIKPGGSVHPSLTARERDNSQAAAAGPTVNERLKTLRLEQSRGTERSIYQAPPSQTVHPSLRGILQGTSDGALPRPRPGLRVVGGRRLPPGPQAPASWLTRRREEAKSSPRPAVMPGKVEQLPGYELPKAGSLTDLCFKQLAKEWDFHSEYDQYYLPTLKGYEKEWLVHYLAVYGTRGIDRRTLDLLFRPNSKLDGATGAGDLVRLDLSRSIGESISFLELKPFLSGIRKSQEADKVHLNKPQSAGGNNTSAVPDDWEDCDEEDSSGLSQAPLNHPGLNPSLQAPIFASLTHLSLASPGTQIKWGAFMNHLVPHLPSLTLTHLSLAHWPMPILLSNSLTAYVRAPNGTHPYGNLSYYSALDQDWSEAASILRRLSKATTSLKWLNLSGCWPWIRCLAIADINWMTDWGHMEILKVAQDYTPGDIDSAKELEMLRAQTPKFADDPMHWTLETFDHISRTVAWGTYRDWGDNMGMALRLQMRINKDFAVGAEQTAVREMVEGNLYQSRITDITDRNQPTRVVDDWQTSPPGRTSSGSKKGTGTRTKGIVVERY